MTKLNVGKDLYLKGRIGWKGLSKDEYMQTGEYRIINATALMDGYVDWNNCGYITRDRYEESEEIMLKENDILISKDGTLGKIGYVKNLTTPTTVASGIFVLRNLISNRLNFDYLYHVLKSNIFKNFIERNKALGSTILHLYQRDLDCFEIVLPNINVQDNIAHVLNDIDLKIELNKKFNTELESIAKTIYDYWFVQFDFPDKNGKPYRSSGSEMVWNKALKREIPAIWQTTIMDDIIDVKDGTHDSPKTVESGHPLITSKHLMDWGLDFLSANLISESDYVSINKRSKVDSGDILFSMIGSVGTVYKIEEKDINFAIKNVALYKTSKNEEYKNFIYMWLKSYYMKSYMSNVLSGSIQKFIGLGDLRTMPIFVPNNETKSYYHLTRSIFEKSNFIREENHELTKLRDWLLPMLMNGQVMVG